MVRLIQTIKKYDDCFGGEDRCAARKRGYQITKVLNDHIESQRSSERVGEKFERWGVEQCQESLLDVDEENKAKSSEEWNDSSTLDGDELSLAEIPCTNPNTTAGERKTAKAERKRAKHQSEVEKITKADLEKLDHALHPDQSLIAEGKRRDASQGLSQNPAIEHNIAFNKHLYKYSSIRATLDDKKSWKADHVILGKEQDHATVDQVLQTLGLDTNLIRPTKERKALDAKLRESMWADLVIDANEQVETMQRMAGYWRYVSRRTYNAMVRMNEIWDW